MSQAGTGSSAKPCCFMNRWTTGDDMGPPSGVSVHEGGREGRDADGDVLRPLRRAVAHPLTLPRDHGLARPDVDRALLVLHAQRPAEHQRVLVELGPLAGLAPAR